MHPVSFYYSSFCNGGILFWESHPRPYPWGSRIEDLIFVFFHSFFYFSYTPILFRRVSLVSDGFQNTCSFLTLSYDDTTRRTFFSFLLFSTRAPAKNCILPESILFLVLFPTMWRPATRTLKKDKTWIRRKWEKPQVRMLGRSKMPVAETPLSHITQRSKDLVRQPLVSSYIIGLN